MSQGFYRHLALAAQQLAAQSGTDNWVHGLRRALGSLGYYMQLAVGDKLGIDVGGLRGCLAAQLAHAWEGAAVNPRKCPSEGARPCTLLR